MLCLYAQRLRAVFFLLVALRSLQSNTEAQRRAVSRDVGLMRVLVHSTNRMVASKGFDVNASLAQLNGQRV